MTMTMLMMNNENWALLADKTCIVQTGLHLQDINQLDMRSFIFWPSGHRKRSWRGMIIIVVCRSSAGAELISDSRERPGSARKSSQFAIKTNWTPITSSRPSFGRTAERWTKVIFRFRRLESHWRPRIRFQTPARNQSISFFRLYRKWRGAKSNEPGGAPKWIVFLPFVVRFSGRRRLEFPRVGWQSREKYLFFGKKLEIIAAFLKELKLKMSFGLRGNLDYTEKNALVLVTSTRTFVRLTR